MQSSSHRHHPSGGLGGGAGQSSSNGNGGSNSINTNSHSHHHHHHHHARTSADASPGMAPSSVAAAAAAGRLGAGAPPGSAPVVSRTGRTTPLSGMPSARSAAAMQQQQQQHYPPFGAGPPGYPAASSSAGLSGGHHQPPPPGSHHHHHHHQLTQQQLQAQQQQQALAQAHMQQQQAHHLQQHPLSAHPHSHPQQQHRHPHDGPLQTSGPSGSSHHHHHHHSAASHMQAGAGPPPLSSSTGQMQPGGAAAPTAAALQAQAAAAGPTPVTSGGSPATADTPGESHASLLRSVIERGTEQNAEAAAALAASGLGPSSERRRMLPAVLQKLDAETEACYVEIGSIAWAMGDAEKALRSFEEAARRNPFCAPALQGLARCWRERDAHAKAMEYAGRSLAIDENGADGEMWSTVGHALLNLQNMHKAYSCYQQAIAKATRKDDPKLWYGIGVLYDRYGSMEHAEEAFASVLKMDPNFYKRDEVFFRLGIIYKLQGKADASLDCFHYILADPPAPLKKQDVWYQIGHALELKKDFLAARDAYERVLRTTPDHSKVLQHLGGLYLRETVPFHNPEQCIKYVSLSLEHGRQHDNSQDPFSWYILGRAFMQTHNYGKAYEAYQQAVYRDGKNPAYWCSIGVLYFNISQYHDALDAYTRAVRIHPFIPEIWQNLGTLYESCNDQLADATDAYQRAVQLDPGNTLLARRLEEVRACLMSGAEITSPAPAPLDIMPDSKSWMNIHFDLTGAKPVYMEQKSLDGPGGASAPGQGNGGPSGASTDPSIHSPVAAQAASSAVQGPAGRPSGSRRASPVRGESPHARHMHQLAGYPDELGASGAGSSSRSNRALGGRNAPIDLDREHPHAYGPGAASASVLSATGGGPPGSGRRVPSGAAAARGLPGYGERPSPTHSQQDVHFRGGAPSGPAVSPTISPRLRHAEYEYGQGPQHAYGHGHAPLHSSRGAPAYGQGASAERERASERERERAAAAEAAEAAEWDRRMRERLGPPNGSRQAQGNGAAGPERGGPGLPMHSPPASSASHYDSRDFPPPGRNGVPSSNAAGASGRRHVSPTAHMHHTHASTSRYDPNGALNRSGGAPSSKVGGAQQGPPPYPYDYYGREGHPAPGPGHPYYGERPGPEPAPGARYSDPRYEADVHAHQEAEERRRRAEVEEASYGGAGKPQGRHGLNGTSGRAGPASEDQYGRSLAASAGEQQLRRISGSANYGGPGRRGNGDAPPIPAAAVSGRGGQPQPHSHSHSQVPTPPLPSRGRHHYSSPPPPPGAGGASASAAAGPPSASIDHHLQAQQAQQAAAANASAPRRSIDEDYDDEADTANVLMGLAGLASASRAAAASPAGQSGGGYGVGHNGSLKRPHEGSMGEDSQHAGINKKYKHEMHEDEY